MTATQTVEDLAKALYEGSSGLYNLAETLARQYGKAEALSFYRLMGGEVHNFWRTIAKQLIDHSAEWQPNQGSSCVLSDREIKRLQGLPYIETNGLDERER